MKKLLSFVLIIFTFSNGLLNGQTILNADGPGNTYELITSILAPGYNPIETPDCSHPGFGRHIEEVWDDALNAYVFAFHIHVNEDDDRCINFDRQRNEIKTYDKSPDSLKGVIGETFIYKWKFKLDMDFQPSNNFTHIHQLKAVGGSESSHPQITLTPRAGSPEELELRYAQNQSSVVIGTADLSLFKGEWVEATEIVTYGEPGVYQISLVNVNTGNTLFYYSNNSIRMWKTDAEFIRPKWGIYRGLNSSQLLRDEIVYFADFYIEELNCPPNYLAVSYGALSGTETGIIQYETDGAIESFQTILPGADVDYDSKIYVELLPGFEVQTNTLFHAYINGCN